MTSLASQLQQIKNNQRAIRVAPNQQQPTLLLDAHTATTTSHDLIFTMAIVAYGKMLKHHRELKLEGESLMSAENRQLNRNTLTKQVNRSLSEKLIKFLLKISPYFMSEDCQKIIEYLLHNYKINIFEAQALAIIYLQYWNTPTYLKLIQNIPEKILAIKIPFLTKLNSKQVFNFTYIVKSLSYSHYLVSSLLIYTLQFIKSQGHVSSSMDIEINVGQEYEQQPQRMARCDPRRFLLQIFTQFMNRQMTASYKYIIQFCGKAVSPSRLNSSETCSMVMILCTRLFIQNSISQEVLKSIIERLLKSKVKENAEIKGLFDFLMIVWQRKSPRITNATLNYLQKSQSFLKYLQNFKCSLWMILVNVLEKCTEGHLYSNLISKIGNKVKRDEFYLLHEQVFNNKLFSLFEKCLLVQEKSSFVVQFFRKNFQYELAKHYNQKQADNTLRQTIKNLFSKQQYNLNKKGQFVFNFTKINKSSPAKKQQKSNDVPSFTTQQQPQQESEDEVIQERKTSNQSLLFHLRNKGLTLNQLNFKDEKVKQLSAQLLQQYYDDNQTNTDRISAQQKNQIIDNYFDLYNQTMFAADLKLLDFIGPIKYLTFRSSLQASKQSINLLSVKPQLFQDVLFRQLLRLALGHIAKQLNTSYKNVMYFLNTLFKKLISQNANKDQSIELLKLSEILLKITEQTLGRVGIRRGKYQKILHNHGKIIAEVIVNLKVKKRVTRELNADQRTVLQHYQRLIKVFGKQNIYLLNIGIIEILTRKEMDHSLVRYFITKIILGAINESSLDFEDLGLSLAKTIVFCSELGSIVKLQLNEIDVSITSGIAKNAISQFFGLIKDKFKRVMIKKMLLFMKSIFQNTYLIETLKLHLVELTPNKLQSLLVLYTQIYKILTLISSEDTQVQNFRQAIMDRITNVFPLNLRLTLFAPLLPNQHLYKYLGSQLQEHAPQKSNFAELQEIVNIQPEQVTFQWVIFVKECLKRGYMLKQESLQKLFPKLDLKNNVTSFAQLICQLATYQPHILYEHLPICMKIFQKHAQQPSNFTLALATKLITNLGQMVQPYLNTLILSSLVVDSQFISTFIKQVTQHLANSTLIKFIKDTYRIAKNITNYSLFFKETVMKGVGDSLTKTLTALINRTLQQKLNAEQNPAEIINLQSQIFLNIALKMNENQLRKSIIDLVRWSEAKLQIQSDLPFNVRKIAVAQIYSQLTTHLQGLFVPFFGYFFDSIIKDFQSISQAYEVVKKISKSSELKRSREENNQYRDQLVQLYLQISLRCLQQLFKADSDHQFLDSVKIDSLGDPITELIMLSQHQNFVKVVSTSLTSCIVSLHSSVTDDYQMKTLNYKVLVLLKRKNSRIQKIIFDLMDQLVDTLQDRFLFLVSDLVPFLLQSAGSRQQGIAKTVRTIIGKIEELSGEQITGYAK